MGSPYTASDVYDPVYDDGGAVFNALNPRFGATFDTNGNVTNGADVLNAALADAAAGEKPATVYVPGGRQYVVDETVVVPENVELRLDPDAVLAPDSTSVTVVQVMISGRLRGGRIEVPASYAAAAVYVEGETASPAGRPMTVVADLTITGVNSGTVSGYGIHLFADAEDAKITWLRVMDVTIRRVGTAVRIEPVAPAEGITYINGNLFSNLTISGCVRGIDMLGPGDTPANCSGNSFSGFVIQPTDALSDIGLSCPSKNNHFSGMIWDAQNFGDVAVRLTEPSSGNLLHLPGVNGDLVDDRGERNLVFLTDNEKKAQLAVIAPGNQNLRSYAGLQDDYLSYADRRFTVSQTAGVAPSGTFAARKSRLFDPQERALGVQWSTTSPVELEIDFGGDITSIENTGLLFRAPDVPDAVTIEAYVNTGSTYAWRTIYSTTANVSRIVVGQHISGETSKASKLRITLQATAGAIWLQHVFGFSGSEGGHAWLPRGGGSVYGVAALDGGVSVGGGTAVSAVFGASGGWSPGSIAAGGFASTTLSVTGSTTDAPVVATLSSLGANDLLISAHVSTDGTVRAVLFNPTGSAIDPGSGTLRAWVLKA